MQALRPGRSGVHIGHHGLALGKKDPLSRAQGAPACPPPHPAPAESALRALVCDRDGKDQRHGEKQMP